jgi:hypothetical protein
MKEFMNHLESVVKELKSDLKHIGTIQNRTLRSERANGLAERALVSRQIIRPLPGTDTLYRRLEVVTEKAIALI